MRLTGLLLILCVLSSSCSTTYLRLLSRGDAKVDDYRFFPQREIPKGTYTFALTSKTSVKDASILLSIFGYQNLKSLVDSTRSQAILVIHGTDIVVEAYGEGLNRQTTVTSFSISKSFTSVMIGNLIRDKKIKSVDQSIVEFIPELMLRDKRFSSISIRDLLSMSSGITYSEFPNPRLDNIETYYNSNLRKLAVTSTKIETAPGLQFKYNNFNPLLLGLIIERASGATVSEFLSKSIWAPMGPEASASWSLDSVESGFEKMESGINARAIDFARFGCLIRDHGERNGSSVVSNAWIQGSLSDAHAESENYYGEGFGRKIREAVGGGFYGYMWYGLSLPRDGERDFFAAGNKSQIIYVAPESDLVIVRFGYEDGIDFWKWIDGFYRFARAVKDEPNI